jgi:hypothetical protein
LTTLGVIGFGSTTPQNAKPRLNHRPAFAPISLRYCIPSK